VTPDDFHQLTLFLCPDFMRPVIHTAAWLQVRRAGERGGERASEEESGRASERSATREHVRIGHRAQVRPSACAAERMCDVAGRRGGSGGLPPTAPERSSPLLPQKK
jgi:hypothetical protein